MGFVLEGLDTESYDRKYSDRVLVTRIFHYFSMYKRKMAGIVIVLLLHSLFGIASPIFISSAIDYIVDTPSYAILAFSFGIMGVGVIAWYFNYLCQMLSAKVIGNVVLDLRKDVLGHVLDHNFAFFDNQLKGKLISRITNDTQDFSNTVSLSVDFFSQLSLVLLLIIWLFTINLMLTLLLLALAPIAIIIALSFRKIARKVSLKSKQVLAEINAQILESISGIIVAKTFRQEMGLYEKFEKSNQKSYHINLQRGIILNTIFPILAIFTGLATAVMVYFGGLGVKHWGMSPGNWYLYLVTVTFVWFPLMSIASFWSQFQDGLSAAERVFALIDSEVTVKQHGDTSLNTLTGAIEMVNLTFAYKSDRKVLSQFSLFIESGEALAVVGHTGAGKSSLIKLIMRFYEFQNGKILIDGKDIRSFNLQNYRKKIGYVPQDPFLFDGSVRDNILYGNSNASPSEVNDVVMAIGSGEWIDDLPDGLDTAVGSRGSTISLGQRQLVALSRVLLKDPAIFLLDEATASIDPFTEYLIQKGLSSLMKKRTSLVIAHRLSTIINADRIIVMKQGNIIEQGTHGDLLKMNGSYTSLYNTYFRHQSIEYIENKGRPKGV